MRSVDAYSVDGAGVDNISGDRVVIAQSDDQQPILARVAYYIIQDEVVA